VHHSRPILAATLVATFALAACGKAPEQTDAVENAAIANTVENAANGIAAPNEDAQANAAMNAAAGSPSVAARAIPAAFHGRWGMVAGDCGPDASIAKGLMTVDGEKLRFYESVGKPAVVTNPTPARMQGRFAFSGEGMEWSKDMTLTLDGDSLVRTETDPAASYRYMRCKD
jgi:hypothetical protein